jgi:hypothetical protein
METLDENKTILMKSLLQTKLESTHNMRLAFYSTSYGDFRTIRTTLTLLAVAPPNTGGIHQRNNKHLAAHCRPTEATLSRIGSGATLSPQAAKSRATAYGNGLFVSVGVGGAIYTSPDTLSWTRVKSTTRHPLVSTAYGNGIFVAVGHIDGPTNGEYSPIVRSTDGCFTGVRFPSGFFLVN